MNRISLLVLLAGLGPLTAACGSSAVASLDEDAVQDSPPFERLIELQAEVELFEGRPVLARHLDAMSRMQRWLDLMAAAPPDEAAVYEQAVRAQLEFLRTSELRRYAEGEGEP